MPVTSSPNTFEQEALKNLLSCPVCLDISEKYYTCVSGHSICSACFEGLNKDRPCPECRQAYADPPTRNYMVEGLLNEIIG